MSEEHLCDVCRTRPMIAVCCSAVGAMSNAYCLECHQNMAEPEWCFHYVWDSTDGNTAGWVDNLTTWKDDRFWTWSEWAAWRQYEWFTPDPMMHWWAFKPHGPLEDPMPEGLGPPQDATNEDFDDVFGDPVVATHAPG